MRPDSGHPIVTSVPLELLDTVSIFVHTLSKPNLCIAIIDLISARSHCTTLQNCYLFFGSKGFNHLVTQHHAGWQPSRLRLVCCLTCICAPIHSSSLVLKSRLKKKALFDALVNYSPCKVQVTVLVCMYNATQQTVMLHNHNIIALYAPFLTILSCHVTISFGKSAIVPVIRTVFAFPSCRHEQVTGSWGLGTRPDMSPVEGSSVPCQTSAPLQATCPQCWADQVLQTSCAVRNARMYLWVRFQALDFTSRNVVIWQEQ